LDGNGIGLSCELNRCRPSWRRTLKRLEAMTIGAPNFAFCDFSQDRGPASATICEGRDISEFLPDVIELENDDVALAAVHARVFVEVLDDLLPHLRTSLCDLPEQPRLLPLVILPVVPGVRFRETIPAPRLQLRLATPHRWKLVQRL